MRTTFVQFYAARMPHNHLNHVQVISETNEKRNNNLIISLQFVLSAVYNKLTPSTIPMELIFKCTRSLTAH